ncbi:uncharacterized protein EAE97_010713 [Botrytis byssoidea]|uniref:DUF4604 domain-containing protein n=1 Tax=Botrytis byssoidea TaxID=139641 RepID=A0A9P5LU63_9HELO|nr:uncharacterized protein EAE97_010713 [Botrytis byssoidea]KAF7924101.1 hypothetical protein EAE97_010713 [Botrytis byssoidea]
MSKITSKNLSYDSTLPPFLQRLQSNHASSSDGRHEFTISRPRKPIDEDAERESEPVVFDEVSGETLSKEEWERREKEREEEEGGVKESEEGEGEEGGMDKKESAKVAVGIGGSKKRKVGKVIGGLEDEEIEKGEEEEKSDAKSSSKKDTGNQKKSESGKVGAASKTKPKAAAKKGKKIKLSFGDDE